VTLSGREVRELLDRHGIDPSRALGQNFVVDPNTVRRIVRLAGVRPGDRVVEVGGGLGSLTLALVEAGARVTTVERDRRLVPVLREVLAGAGAAVDVVEGDALVADWQALCPPAEGPWVMVANLPYNIATPLVLDLLERVPAIERMLVMVQREVAERLAAAPGSSAYGIPSVKVAYRASAELVGTVPATVFLPRPRVESGLLRLERRSRPATDADPAVLFALVDRAFGQRRKMLRRSLAGVVPDEAFAAAGIAPDARPETLSVEDWGRLARAVA
jgi:16S rRNA (adenine1518-N6/adenine1519-N6)-dimethyltransferase